MHRFTFVNDCKNKENNLNFAKIIMKIFTTMNTRMKKVIDYLGLSVLAFTRKCGISEGCIRKVIVENTSITSTSLQKIAENFPEINLDWLLTGRGSMLYGESVTTAKRIYDPLDDPQLTINHLHERLADKDDLITALRETITVLNQKK